MSQSDSYPEPHTDRTFGRGVTGGHGEHWMWCPGAGVVLGCRGLFYWPIFVVAGWGIGIVANAWDAYSNDIPTESQISHQMDRMRRR